MKSIKITTLLAYVALATCSANLFAETWQTRNAYRVSDPSGDPLVFEDTTRTKNVNLYGVGKTGSTLSMLPSGVSYDTNGVGVTGISSSHTIDNLGANGTSMIEGIVLDFGSYLADIESITLSSDYDWHSSRARDQDFQLYAFNAIGPVSEGAFSDWSKWTLVDTVNGMKASSTTRSTLTKSYSTDGVFKSTAWLVLAMNADSNSDAFKFNGLTASLMSCTAPGNGCAPGSSSGGVPIPGTLALLGIGALATRRRFLKLS